MILIHTSQEQNFKSTPENASWIFDQCVFFTGVEDGVDRSEIKEAAYAPHDADGYIFCLTVREDQIIDAGDLDPDAKALADVACIWGESVDYYGDDIEIDAEDMIRGDMHDQIKAEGAVDDGGWHIQRIRAQLARRMGYTAVRDWDEQGVVYIVDFAERSDEMNRRMHALGAREPEGRMAKDEFKSWRKRLSLTQAEAAKRIGISRRTVQDYEAGKWKVPHYIELACEAIEAKMEAEAAAEAPE